MAVVRIGAVALALLVAGAATAARPDKPLTSAQDLRYGAALYDYYRGEYMDALSELMVADLRGGIEGHDDNPQLMEGGFSLAYGMERRASELFQRVLDGDRPRPVRDAAWFYLARLRYLNGDWLGTEAALQRISDEPDGKLAEEISALRVNLAIRQGRVDDAQKRIDDLAPGEGWLPYVYYNMGAAESRAGRFDRAVEYYNHLSDMPLTSDEHLALYDKAMTAAGYSYLLNGQFADAQAQFSRVRLDSPVSNRALLGYGWAAAEQDDYREALKPWLRLTQQSLADENTQEALLAVPYAYEQLGNKGLALQHFQRAENSYAAEVAVLDKVIANIEGETMLAALDIRQSESLGGYLGEGDDQLSPQLTYLAELFSRESFQGQVRQLRDLLALQTRMHEWRDKLSLYEAMLDEREARRGAGLDFIREQRVDTEVERLKNERERIVENLARIQAEQDYLALASGEQAELLEWVASVEENIAALEAAGQDVSEYREQFRRYRGMLLWDASQDFAARLWQAQKQLQQLDQRIQSLEATRERVQRVIVGAQDLEPYRQRLSAANQRLTRHTGQLDKAVAEAKEALRQEVVAVLGEQRERLRHYLAQARLSVARLYDSARTEEQ